MTTATAACQFTDVEVDERLRVWRERWRYAPDVMSRTHALAAIDVLLDRRLEFDVSTPAIPAQEAPSELDAHALA